MQHLSQATDRVYRMALALRSRYAELRPLTGDRNLSEALDDLSGQHARHAAEIADLASDRSPTGTSNQDVTDGASGDEHLIPPSLPLGLDPSIANILTGAIEAERDLQEAYRRAIEAEPPNSSLLSTLERQNVAVGTMIGRLDAMSAYS